MSVPQSYLPKGYCWNDRPVQVAIVIRPAVLNFCATHPRLRAFSGFRRTGVVINSDHLCGMAVDFVPLTQDDAGKAALERAAADAKARGYPYVELEWTATNKHLHVSFRRCPRT